MRKDRSEDLFKQLESRDLTQDEQAIIQSRVKFPLTVYIRPSPNHHVPTSPLVLQVDFQRKMLDEYERREKARQGVKAITASFSVLLLCCTRMAAQTFKVLRGYAGARDTKRVP